MAVSLVDRIPRPCGPTMAGWAWARCVRASDGDLMRVLEIDGTYQSATYLDERWCDPTFPYHWLFDHVFDAWPEGDGPQTMAILGGGGYALPKHYVAHHPEVRRIDVVEIDPAIEHIARRHFYLDRLERETHAIASGRLHLHIADARLWLERCGRRFDAIINDCFSGLTPERSLMTPEAARIIRSHLNEGGLYLTNVVSAHVGPDARPLRMVRSSLQAGFTQLWVYAGSPEEPDARDNNVVVASDADHALRGYDLHVAATHRKDDHA